MSSRLSPLPRPAVSDTGSLAALSSLLADLRDVIALVPLHCYRAQPAARVSGSIGAHVRHTLDHVAALIDAIDGDQLRYDHRKRGTTLEIDPMTGVNEIERLLFRLDRIAVASLDVAVSFSARLHPQQPPAMVRTTLAREAAFVVQHTVHHCALVAVLLEWQGERVPSGFGVAASTLDARRAG